jgi:hypothetical protein
MVTSAARNTTDARGFWDFQQLEENATFFGQESVLLLARERNWYRYEKSGAADDHLWSVTHFGELAEGYQGFPADVFQTGVMEAVLSPFLATGGGTAELTER